MNINLKKYMGNNSFFKPDKYQRASPESSLIFYSLWITVSTRHMFLPAHKDHSGYIYIYIYIGTLPYCLYTQKNMFSVYITSEQTSCMNVGTLVWVDFLLLNALLLRCYCCCCCSVVILMNACFLFDDNFCAGYHICT